MVQETWDDSMFERELYGLYDEYDYLYSDLVGFRLDFYDEEFLNELNELGRRDSWSLTFDNNFALDFFQSLLSGVLPTQLGPFQCCASCTSVASAHCNISPSEVSVSAKNCQLCDLLLRKVKSYCTDDELNVQIVRERSWLKVGNKGPRIFRLSSDRECSAHPDNDIQISFPALAEAENPARFALLRAWLRWCDKSESHECNKHDAESKAELPTRLLYVGDPDPDVLYLYCPKEMDRMRYVALSHRWGEHPPTKDSSRFCTTDDNINTRLKGFSFSELPKTFRDAVRVTRELGIQYLWIDSLCIIQWNKKDWDDEAKRMESVFASAYCTIAATSAGDSEAGFLERNLSSEYVYAQDASGRRFYVCTDIDDFDKDVEKAPLNTRAWVLQERVLSRRTIHFSANQTYFECGAGVYCENLTILKSSFRKKSFMLDPNFPDRLLASGDQRTMEFIHFLAEDYSKRGLTKETDRCIAVSGLEARIARVIGCESRYGIFQCYLHRNLLWQSSDNKMKRIKYKTRNVPSWSWMAYDRGIQFVDISFGEACWINNLRFDEECEVALIADVGKFLDCTMQVDGKRYAVLYSGGMKRGWIQYDVEEGGDLCKERCVVVGKVYVDEDVVEDVDRVLKEYYILVVRPTSVDGEFSRVGVGLIQSDYVARQRLKVRVV